MDINEIELRMEEAIESLEKKYVTIQAGRANPAIVDNIMVDYFGNRTPLKAISNITVHEGKSLFIKPYDRQALKEIEHAINEANIGIAPTNNGEMIILTVPPLTEETRKNYVKDAKEASENAKIAIRNIRQDANTQVKRDELPEDQEKQELDKVQELVKRYNDIIDQKAKEKEKELMEI